VGSVFLYRLLVGKQKTKPSTFFMNFGKNARMRAIA
jgi:hypothetical protein